MINTFKSAAAKASETTQRLRQSTQTWKEKAFVVEDDNPLKILKDIEPPEDEKKLEIGTGEGQRFNTNVKSKARVFEQTFILRPSAALLNSK